MMPLLHKFQTFRRSGHRLHFTRVHYFGEPQVLFGETLTFVTSGEKPELIIVDQAASVVRVGAGIRNFDHARWYRQVAREYLRRRTASLAQEHGFYFGRVFVRSQRTR